MRTAILLVFLIIQPFTAHAILCSPPASDEKDKPPIFILTVAKTLTKVKEYADRVSKVVDKRKSDPSDFIYANIELQEAYECAEKTLEPFKESTIKEISESTTILILAYKNLGQMNIEQGQLFKKMIDGEGPASPSEQGTAIAEIKFRSKKNWESLILGITATTFALVDKTPKEKMNMLSITVTEKEEVLKELRKQFKNTPKGDLPYAEAAAQMYFDFFNQKWQYKK